jgi:hypothetical protein
MLPTASPGSYRGLAGTLAGDKAHGSIRVQEGQPDGSYYIKSSMVRRLEEAAIGKYRDYARMMPTLLSAIAFQQLHGAVSRVRFDDTAFIEAGNAGMRCSPLSTDLYI